ncbi:MAG TPA: tetratricopeptide repeat protein [bacterium]|nr:tetratricopeptide repeat protein [bacterium]
MSGPISEFARDRRAALVALVVWGVLMLLAGSAPYERWWGVNLLAFAAPEIRIGFFILLLAGIAFVAITRPSTSEPRVPFAAALFLTAAGAWLLRAEEAFLGDGTLRAMDAMKAVRALPSEILPTALAGAMVRFLPPSWGLDGYDALRLVSVISAIAFVALLWRLIPRALGEQQRGVIFWLLSFGAVRLFAGYIETYTPAFVFFVAWTLAAWGYWHRRLGAGWVIAFWILAVLSHVTAVLLIPATLWVLLRDDAGAIRWGQRAAWAFAAIALLFGGGVIGAFYWFQVELTGVSGGHFFMTLVSEPPHEYGLFSAAHLLDTLNAWFLLAPAFLVVGPAWLLRHGGAARQRAARPSTSALGFWLLAAGLPILAGFVIDPKLGWARDWDLYALLCAPALTGIALAFNRLSGPLRHGAMVIAIVSASLWLSFSADGNAERRRFEALLELDDSRSDYGHEILAQHYRRAGDYEGALRHYRAALAVSENTRYRLNIAAAYYNLRRYTEAIHWYTTVLEHDSVNAAAHYGLSLTYGDIGQHAEALPHAEAAARLDAANPTYLYRYGAALLASGKPAEALPVLRRAAQLNPNDAGILNAIAVCALELNQQTEAESAITLALRLTPDEPVAWLNAARVALNGHKLADARRCLERYEALTAPGDRHPAAQMLLDSLSRMSDTVP